MYPFNRAVGQTCMVVLASDHIRKATPVPIPRRPVRINRTEAEGPIRTSGDFDRVVRTEVATAEDGCTDRGLSFLLFRWTRSNGKPTEQATKLPADVSPFPRFLPPPSDSFGRSDDWVSHNFWSQESPEPSAKLPLRDDAFSSKSFTASRRIRLHYPVRIPVNWVWKILQGVIRYEQSSRSATQPLLE
jgi:hypothetical protein